MDKIYKPARRKVSIAIIIAKTFSFYLANNTCKTSHGLVVIEACSKARLSASFGAKTKKITNTKGMIREKKNTNLLLL
jgi:hypothetical protein